MKKMKKLAALLAALALLFGAIGCSDGDSGESHDPDYDGNTPPITGNGDNIPQPPSQGDDGEGPTISDGPTLGKPNYDISAWDIDESTGVLRSYYGSDTDVTIPSIVTSIGDIAFRNLDIKSVTIPEGVTEIGMQSFEGCTSLSSITLPKSLKEIGYGAFHGCTSLEEVNIPEGVKIIGTGAFYECTSLMIVTLPVSLEEIKDNAFNSCTSLAIVKYAGTIAQWNDITLGEYLFVFTKVGVNDITYKK